MNPTNTVFYLPEPRAEVYCLQLNFKISKLSNRPFALRSHVIFSAMLEGKQIGCYGKQWLPRGITIGQLRKYLH